MKVFFWQEAKGQNGFRLFLLSSLLPLRHLNLIVCMFGEDPPKKAHSKWSGGIWKIIVIIITIFITVNIIIIINHHHYNNHHHHHHYNHHHHHHHQHEGKVLDLSGHSPPLCLCSHSRHAISLTRAFPLSSSSPLSLCHHYDDHQQRHSFSQSMVSHSFSL